MVYGMLITYISPPVFLSHLYVAACFVSWTKAGLAMALAGLPLLPIRHL